MEKLREFTNVENIDKDVYNFFDVNNIEHIKAYKHLNDTGMWTKEFVEEAEKNGYKLTIYTTLLITGKICNGLR